MKSQTHRTKKVQNIFKKIRQRIRNEAPDATERISYGIPTFDLNSKYLVYFAAFKNNISLYPATSESVDSDETLSKYKVSKGTLRFPLDKPIPFDLIKKFVQYRIKENKLFMVKILKIDRALYEVDNQAKTYRYLKRNPDWKKLSQEKNRRNKKQIDGYTRIFRDGRRKIHQ